MPVFPAGVGWSWGKGVALTPPQYLGWNETQRIDDLSENYTGAVVVKEDDVEMFKQPLNDASDRIEK
ncbi:MULTISPECIES: hypothetical protein [Acidobacteriaceae]|uniref:hypothetical protein n=1 Tax=Acidobacteriaceae TaxID=204434 RepID=UPI00131D68A8|nr:MULTISPECIES: hypothetical protein [Acidobacteriaceae]MDW5266823.1 hypothetical protein [Edaphobacter sp.]